MTNEMTKEFKIGFMDYTISRADYECMPMPMDTCGFDDEKMQSLADDIGLSMRTRNLDTDNKDKIDEVFWEEMENSAIEFGMTYYNHNEESFKDKD